MKFQQRIKKKQTTVKRVSIQELCGPLYLNINKRSLFQFQ